MYNERCDDDIGKVYWLQVDYESYINKYLLMNISKGKTY